MHYSAENRVIIVDVLLTTIIGAVGFFIKGEDAEFSTGTQVNTSVASDMEIEQKK